MSDRDCDLCGDTLEVDVLEWWPDERAFMLTTCCEERYEIAVDQLNEALDGDQDARRAFATWFAEQTGSECRGTFDDDGTAKLDYGLTLGPITRDEARAFVGTHHRHNRPPVGWRWGHGIFNGRDLVGVAMVGRPVAPAIDPTTVVEVNRVCVRDDLAPMLVWNACSMLYAAAAREAKTRGFQKVITYTRDDEAGTSLRGAGWARVSKSRGGSWHRPNRPRTERPQENCPKYRWERILNPAPRTPVTATVGQLALAL